MDVVQRELIFRLVCNLQETKERLHKCGQAVSSACDAGDGAETIVNMFCECIHVQAAWAWMRRKIITKSLAMPQANNLELINLVSGVAGTQNEKDFIFLIVSYVQYVWKKRKENRLCDIDVDKLKDHLLICARLNQQCQNKVRRDLLE